MSASKDILTSVVIGAILGTLILGVGGRLLMRLIAILGDVNPGFSLGGSLEVVAFGTITGALGALAFPFIYKLMAPRPGLRGIVFGGLLFVIILLLPIDSKLAAKGFPQLIFFVYLSFGLLFLVFGYFHSRLYSAQKRKSVTN